ncbi:MAG: exodeoxyribonuclease III [Lachnospiraceae bacterium]|nr:exodeoxyribonuclease III [Lachnospiraceae bacterium]MCI9281902.1 exodeoxyribonuclease III [Lachnospiraceae bacterium]
MKRLYSWNVNGLRACMNKGFRDFLEREDPDVLCLQETKMQPEQADFEFPGYHLYWNSAVKKGYSGTLVLTKEKPLSVINDLGLDRHNTEGRTITLEYLEHYLVNVYVPNAQNELARLGYRMQWEDDFRGYLGRLKEKKPVIVTGDFNVAKEEIDLKNPQNNRRNAGFSDEERGKMRELLASGFVDSFRYLYPDQENAYSWWSYRFKARERNAGWRIDYFLVSAGYEGQIEDSRILADQTGSDHCPVELILKS